MEPRYVSSENSFLHYNAPFKVHRQVFWILTQTNATVSQLSFQMTTSQWVQFKATQGNYCTSNNKRTNRIPRLVCDSCSCCLNDPYSRAVWKEQLWREPELQNVISFTKSKYFKLNFTPWKVHKSHKFDTYIEWNWDKWLLQRRRKKKSLSNMSGLKTKTHQN